MRIGLDFDNTIVSYDRLFYRVALEQGAVPEHIPANKVAVRDYLRRSGKEAVWTEMQGYVYGARMAEADAYPGLLDALKQWIADGHQLYIVSHKTRYPFLGPQYDLHTAAHAWIAANLQVPPDVFIADDSIYFELTKEAKIARIAKLECNIFIDDLPEILHTEQFPAATQRLLFDPEGHYDSAILDSIIRFQHWHELPGRLKAREWQS